MREGRGTGGCYWRLAYRCRHQHGRRFGVACHDIASESWSQTAPVKRVEGDGKHCGHGGGVAQTACAAACGLPTRARALGKISRLWLTTPRPEWRLVAENAGSSDSN